MHRVVAALLAALTLAAPYARAETGPRFLAAQPVWPEGRSTERNLTVAFRAVIDVKAPDTALLRLTASTLYRAFVNGEFAGYGPARGPHGYFRIDEIDIAPLLRPGKNVVAIEVAGYNVNSYYTIDAPSFLQAEVVCDGNVAAATGAKDGFLAAIVKERVQKTQRYSFQRPFSEVYRLSPGYDAWRASPNAPFASVACAAPEGTRAFLPRRVPYPRFNLRPPLLHAGTGTLKTGVAAPNPWKDRALTQIGPKLGGYPENELATIPSLELQTVASVPGSSARETVGPHATFELGANSYRILDFGTNLTGFLGATVTCTAPTRFFMTFDEILASGDVDWKRLGCVNIVAFELAPGTYALESFEPYTLRYLKLMVLEGACRVEKIYLREYVNPATEEAHFASSDQRLNRLFDAGRETYRQNAVDVFMDCPSRERAGWLCDSFFTARTARALSGDTTVERNFVENYLLPPKFAFLPDGMLPMCYPADHHDGVFIPNWALWFVVELEEYLARSGDRATVDALEGRVLRLFDYFARFKNSDGLLEKLESWVFVEWSAANNFVQDVNYPSNMLYAAALAAAGRMYALPALGAEAQKLRDAIRAQSFDGTFFVDNAVRKDGKLQPTRNRTEVCQYFAFFFDVASPATHAELWRTLKTDFGPRRKDTKLHPEIHAANAFIGNMLRIEILSRAGAGRQILDESVEYLMYMEKETGTLWENVGAYASCNHGFASHIVHTLYRDVLGLYQVDTVGKRVKLRITDVALAWCEGRLPTPHGPIVLRWTREGSALAYRLDLPAGYTVEVENLSSLAVTRQP